MIKVLFFVLLNCLVFGQNSKIDSLRNELKESKNNSFKILNLLAWKYTTINPDSTFYYNNLSKKHIKSELEKGRNLVLNVAIEILNNNFKAE